jgi:hypothetical protein
MLAITRTARAQGIMGGSIVPAGVVFENDAFLTGNDIVLDGTVAGDVLAVGRTVTINGDIAGSLVALAETVTVNGDVDGSVYSGAVTFELGESSTIDRSAYFVGARLVTQSDSQIKRDLVAGTLGAQLNGNVGRDVRAVIGLVEIVDRVLKAFNVEPNLSDFRIFPSREATPEVEESVAIEGALLPAGLSLSKQAKLVRPAGGLAYQMAIQSDDEPAAEGDNLNNIGDWSLERLRILVEYLIVGVLAAWIFPARFYRWSDRLRARPIASGLYGFVGLVTGFAGVIILSVLVLTVGIGLAAASLTGLAVATWGLGFSSTWLAFSIFLLFVLFLSKVIVSYLGGRLILERLAPRAAQHWIWPLLLGLIIYVLLIAIPYLGLVIGFTVTILGLGAAILALSRRDVYTWKTAEEEE